MITPLVSLASPAVPATQAHALGVSLREIELLLALAADARAGRLRLPLDELERVHLPPESLAHPPWPAALDALPPAARPLLRGLIVWATLACAGSARAEQRLPQADTARDHHAPLDGWRAWRVARRVDAQRPLGGTDL